MTNPPGGMREPPPLEQIFAGSANRKQSQERLLQQHGLERGKLEARLTDVRRSCEYVATFAAATIYGNSLKAGTSHRYTHNLIFVMCGASVLLGVLGATSTLFHQPRLRRLEQTLAVRIYLRMGAALALGIAFGLMIWAYWDTGAVQLPPPCCRPP